MDVDHHLKLKLKPMVKIICGNETNGKDWKMNLAEKMNKEHNRLKEVKKHLKHSLAVTNNLSDDSIEV